jgi:hypothetical protein
MADDFSGLTWIERAQQDLSLRAFVNAEPARAAIELDTHCYQHGIDRPRIAPLIATFDAVNAPIETVRRRLGPWRRPLAEPEGAAG